MSENPADIAPELALLGGAVVGLLLGMFAPRRRQWLVGVVAALALVVALVTAAVAIGRPNGMAFDSYALDPLTHAARLIVAAATLLTLPIAAGHVRGAPREAEFYVLLLLGALGATVLAGADDLLLLIAAYLLASVPLYALTGFAKDGPGTEATLKYYLMGALLGIIMLTGVTLLLGGVGATAYPGLAHGAGSAPRALVAAGAAATLAGLFFKAGAVPAQFWVPDVVDGTRPPVAAFVTTIPKIGALIAVYRLIGVALDDADVHLRLLIAIVAAATMTLGNLAAFFQRSVRRLLAYSTVSQVGYLLMGVAAAHASGARPALVYYLAAYAAANLGAFAVVAALPRLTTIADYRGLIRTRPLLALSLIICLLALIGTPPTGVFVGKLTIFTAAIDAGYLWLAVLAVVNTVASVFYYLRWIAPVFGDRPATPAPTGAPLAAGGAYLATVLAVLLGPAAAPLLALAGG